MPVGPSRVVSVFTTFREPLVAGARVADDWKLFTESLSQPLPETIAKTELPLWSPARFTGPRSIENVADIWALVLDVDEDPIPDAHELAQALFGFRAVCYSSSSASAAAPRWRAVIELSRTVTAEEYTRAANAFVSLLPFAVGSASRDPARQWYFPRDGGGGHFEWISLTGEPLDVDELLAMSPADLPPPPAGTARARGETQHYPGDIVEPVELDRRRKLYAEYLRAEAPARGPERRGQGDQTLFEVVQRGAYDLALPVDDVLELVREHYDPRCSPQWGDELEERVHHKAHDAKTTSTKPRAEPLPADLVHRQSGIAPADTNIAGAISAPSDEETERLETELKITWGRWDEPLPPAVYTISPIVPEATLGVIVAKGSSLKTWLVLSMLSAVARGVPWLGCFPTVQGAAMLVDFESGRDIIHERVQYLRTHDAPQLGIASFPSARIDDPKFWIKLANVVIARGVKMIAIDSFANGATGVDENDSTAALPLQYATTFVEATRCAVVFIHHAKKGGEGGDERDLVRGSGAIFGAADWIYTMVPQDEDRTKMQVRCIKAFRKKTDDFVVALTVDGLVLDASAAPEAEETTKAQQRILETVRAVPGMHTLVDISRAARVKSGAFTKEDITSLVAQRRITLLPLRGYIVDSEAARRARILDATKTPGLTTPQALANAAHVHVDEVHALMKLDVVFRSGTGFGCLS